MVAAGKATGRRMAVFASQSEVLGSQVRLLTPITRVVPAPVSAATKALIAVEVELGWAKSHQLKAGL